MHSCTELLETWPTDGAAAKAIGEPERKVGAWRARNSIPSRYLYRVYKAAINNGVPVEPIDILRIAERDFT